MQKDLKSEKQNKMNWKPIIFFYIKTTSWIILPVLIGIVLKSYLPQVEFFLIIILAFGITCFGIYKEIKDYKNTLNKENGDK